MAFLWENSSKKEIKLFLEHVMEKEPKKCDPKYSTNTNTEIGSIVIKAQIKLNYRLM